MPGTALGLFQRLGQTIAEEVSMMEGHVEMERKGWPGQIVCVIKVWQLLGGGEVRSAVP